MHQLLLLRHAKAEKAREDESDHDRALSERGRHAARGMRERMRAMGIEPDVVLVSSARRTRETLDLVTAWQELSNVDVLDALYMAGAQRMIDLLRAQRETARSLLLVGHNPGLHELAVLLARNAEPANPAAQRLAEGFPTGRLAEYLVLTPWPQLAARSVRLQRVVDPDERWQD